MADEELLIDFELAGIDVATKDLVAFSREIARLPKLITVRFDLDVGAAQHSIARAAAGLSKSVSKVSVGGPTARAAKASAAYASDPSFDSYHALLKSQRVLKRAHDDVYGKPIADKLKDALMTSRVGMGAGGMSLMPLVNRLLPIAGPIGLAATAAVGGLKMLDAAAMSAAERWHDVSMAKIMLGASYSQMNAAGGTMMAAGGPGNAAAMGREVADRLSTDVAAQVLGRRHGIVDPFGNNALVGNMDKLSNLSKALREIVSMADDNEALRLASALHLEEFYQYRSLSAASKQDLLAQSAPPLSPAMDEAQAELLYANKKLAAAAQKLDVALMPWVRLKTSGYEGLAYFLQPDVLSTILPFGSLARGQSGVDLQDVQSGGGILSEALQKAIDAGTRTNDTRRRLDDPVVDELKEMNAMMREGIFGGGERGRNAYPSSVGRAGQAQGDDAVTQAMRIGAFGIL